MDECCTVNLTVRYLTKKWMLLIILELFKGENHTRRFSELKDRLPDITAKVLSERLQELEAEGIVSKHVDASVVPIRSEYTLTASGIELMEVVRGIKYWALKWKIDNIPCGDQECKHCKL
ncbi:HTH-type transcriptional activator HxlR [Methanocorpusculaceae archaeon Sp1]|uniref:HTH-type transcriptional activator HxlR n=1 Tax=Methanorbis furvi TaxID=3028299 RepID=A0AAE4MDS4_9EURY|nr:HTH-type transcriptional activator HxlR [Methanocorpusculaceae archaeon Sp1]MDV0441878.1 HTH-type transcriptional activator HxlR [Methanocorpusculaceae archaeon Ag1]